MNLDSSGPTLGVVGGGQLGRMLCEAAAPLGVEVVVLDPTPDPPAAPVARDAITAGFEDRDAVADLAARADYLTYEIELADPDLLEDVSETAGVPVHPAPSTLGMIQDKSVQKRRLREAGIPVPAFRDVDSLDDLEDALDDLGTPTMLKAREGGYDGRGNVPIETRDDAEEAFEAIDGPAMVEEFVPFERELSVIGVRGKGETAAFVPSENIHEEEILRETVAPARAPEPVRERALEVASEVLDLMEGRGVFGIELFEVSETHSVRKSHCDFRSPSEARSASEDASEDSSGRNPRDAGEAGKASKAGEILVNEIAPRPHNSGHWTIEGARTSQFEQHVRGVLGWPLGATALRGKTVTKNLLGSVEEPRPVTLGGVESVLEEPGAHLHWYGKREVRSLRKMGHVTFEGDDGESRDALLSRARDLVRSVTVG